MDDSFAYKYLIDPLLSGLHRETSGMVPHNIDVLDVACGTGALSLKLAGRANSVTGIDISNEMIRIANLSRDKRLISNAHFHVCDATQISIFTKKHFHLATVSLAIHQFQRTTADQVIKQLKKVADQILFIDYSAPFPGNIYRPLIFFIERLAGKEHYDHFKNYLWKGGLPAYASDHSFEIVELRTTGSGIFTLMKCKTG